MNFGINQKFGNRDGIYFLYSCKDDIPISINRLSKTDNKGILYIGKAVSFIDRVELKKSLSPDHQSKKHECGSRMKRLKLLNNFKYESLFVKLVESDNEKELELYELEKYELEFG